MTDAVGSVGADYDLHESAFLKEKPRAIVLWELWIPTPHETVVHEAQIRIYIQHFTAK